MLKSPRELNKAIYDRYRTNVLTTLQSFHALAIDETANDADAVAAIGGILSALGDGIGNCMGTLVALKRLVENADDDTCEALVATGIGLLAAKAIERARVVGKEAAEEAETADKGGANETTH